MFKRQGIIAAFLFIFLSTVVVMSLYADEYKCMSRCERMMKMDLDKLLFYKFKLIMLNEKELNISSKQMEPIKDLMIATKKNIIRQDAEIEILALDIKAALLKETVDIEGINAIIDKKYNIKRNKAKTLITAYAELKNILTKDQVSMMKELMKGRCEVRGGGMMMEKMEMKKKMMRDRR